MLRTASLVAFLSLFLTSLSATADDAFDILEATISEAHAEMAAGRLTAEQLVTAYLQRIERYDQASGLNAIIVVNGKAMERAKALDEEYANTGTLRPLHGIPVVVKDNFDTADLPTTGGSIALKDSVPPDDAFLVKKLREAGAIILAKTNMAEWAFSPVVTVSSVAGTTRNPYDLERVPAGSSGGTAAAVAANLAMVGLGTDTGNSIRGPSSHTALVGIRSTMGATSRDGIIPLNLRNDIGGPMARTVEDAARVFEVVVGYDPADPITKRSQGKLSASYVNALDKDGLQGARLGVFRRYLIEETTDPQILALMEAALADLEAAGATIVDPFDISLFNLRLAPLGCDRFVYDINNYFDSLGDAAPYATIQEIWEAGAYDPSIKQRLAAKLESDTAPDDRFFPCNDVYSNRFSRWFRDAVTNAMEKAEIDAIIYPTWSYPPRRIGDLDSPSGNNSAALSPKTGFPSITVPIGYVDGSLPAGMTFVGQLFSEEDLIRYSYSFEQATQHRRPPADFD
ncbi:MAG: amidase family protein [Pseudomonadota bacterium]